MNCPKNSRVNKKGEKSSLPMCVYNLYSRSTYYLAFTRSSCRFSYLCLVAMPPLICLSRLFSSRICLTCLNNTGDAFLSRSVRSLCTVDLLTPKTAAVARTVPRWQGVLLVARRGTSHAVLCLSAQSCGHHRLR